LEKCDFADFAELHASLCFEQLEAGRTIKPREENSVITEREYRLKADALSDCSSHASVVAAAANN